MYISSLKEQQGTVLVVALILLSLMTLLGVSTIKSSTTSLKIAGNDREKYNTYQVAYAAIDRAMVEYHNELGVQTAIIEANKYAYAIENKSDGTAQNIVVDLNISEGMLVITEGECKLKKTIIVRARSASNQTNSIQVQGLQRMVLPSACD